MTTKQIFKQDIKESKYAEIILMHGMLYLRDGNDWLVADWNRKDGIIIKRQANDNDLEVIGDWDWWDGQRIK